MRPITVLACAWQLGRMTFRWHFELLSHGDPANFQVERFQRPKPATLIPQSIGLAGLIADSQFLNG
jgi:hypothetical protein